MKKTYSAPALHIYQVKPHNQLCNTSARGTVSSDSFYYEKEEDL